MRIFTRQAAQSIVIGDCISVTVVAIRGAQVRIGVTAPRALDIQREEIRGKGHGAQLRQDQRK
jgi:carbon storage regulator